MMALTKTQEEQTKKNTTHEKNVRQQAAPYLPQWDIFITSSRQP